MAVISIKMQRMFNSYLSLFTYLNSEKLGIIGDNNIKCLDNAYDICTWNTSSINLPSFLDVIYRKYAVLYISGIVYPH